MIRNAVYLITGFLLATAGAVFAGDGVTVRGAGSTQAEGCPEGYVCVTEEEYELHWDVCPIDPTYTPTVEETPTSPPPSETPTPIFTPTLTPSLTPTPTDENGEREACNRGIGNLEENCDPGNSSGQGQGEARPAGEDRDESDGAPPPGRGNGKPDK